VADRRLLLLGGGHAHLFVLKRLAESPLPGVTTTLVAPFPQHHYSGMVPGYLQGTYEEAQLVFDLPRLCRAAGARFVRALAERIDGRGQVVTAGGRPWPFDVCAVDVGSEAASLDTPGVREHAYTVRPMSRVVALRTQADAVIARGGTAPVRVGIVGGGAGGVEVALALERRIRDRGRSSTVTLLDGADTILVDYAPRVRALALAVLASRGVRVATGRSVRAVGPDTVTVDGGDALPSDLTVWLTGAAPPALLGVSAVPRDSRGFLHVDATLRAVDGAPIWGAGDCVTLAAHPSTPRAGVYAVRAAPVLDRNLRAALVGGPPARYEPQRSFLALLNTADGKAILRWRGVATHARSAWWLKDWIDRRFVRAYQTVG
jgi:selenide,water dikinase